MAGPTAPTLAAFVGGMLALHAWTRLRERRRKHEMARRSAAPAAPRAAEGDAYVSALGARAFGVARGDTALVIIDLQNDYVDADGPVLRHYSAAEAGRMHASLSSTDRRFLRYYYVWGFANVLLGGIT